METNLSQIPISSTNGLENRVFHADISNVRVDSQLSGHDGGASSSPIQQSPVVENTEEQKRGSQMQLMWDELIAKNMGLPDGYQRVSVLLIKWADELDDLKTRGETVELATVFRERFHYDTEIVELNVSSKPQLQLNQHLTTFVAKNDGPHNLLIVYYTGHGRHIIKEDFLQLTPYGKGNATFIPKTSSDYPACANWNKAEEALRDSDVDGDVLTILDTCYSSNLAKSGREDVRNYELLSAASMDQGTPGPGRHSFTRALITALKNLVENREAGRFTTFELNQQMNLDPDRRECQSHLWYRLKQHERHISLAPLKANQNTSLRPPPPRGYLTLRFGLTHDSLDRPQIEYLTHRLSKAFPNKRLLGLHKIEWLGMKSARSTDFGWTALALYAVSRWRNFVRKRKAEREQPGESQQQVVTRKRAREDSPELSDSKRGFLAAPKLDDTPPSPPVSESS